MSDANDLKYNYLDEQGLTKLVGNLKNKFKPTIRACYEKSPALYAHGEGDIICFEEHLYTVTEDIDVGDTITDGDNIESYDVDKDTAVYIENLPGGGGGGKQQGYIIPASESATVDVGSTTTVPLTIIGDGAISVTSSDSTKATGSVSNGVLTITGVGGGIATITITMADSATYLGTSATVNVTSVPNGSTATPTDDIQTWLGCASIFDKSYTTISDVLADSSTLATLISSQNAVDYMVRSTSWATTVCANQTAISLIGLNNYAANTLLADSTWLEAICNSEYFESVLNVKVPTMTSNTAPSGEASASRTHETNYPYKAFDNDDNTTSWLSTNQVYASGDWIQYMFVNPVCVKKVSFFDTPTNGVNRIKDYSISASNDGQSWDVIQTGTLPSTSKRERVDIPLENNNSYKYWRLTSISAHSANAFDIYTLQFYGREDV